jgi:DNA sulfur modification protein DndD
MLRLKRIEVTGFGPFAERQVVEFPPTGVTVIYGENMRGKTTLLNAIRYAFFGNVLSRGSRTRRLHTISNRDLATEGKYGFAVQLTFEYDGEEYELVRRCVPRNANPTDDHDYAQEVMLRRGTATLGPQERERALQQIFPAEVSRFFLFDGELLQEYEELLINESDTGHRISEAIEKILGVPMLKRGRMHLTSLSEGADRLAAKEASKHQETQAIGTALQTAAEQKEAHQKELARLNEQLRDLTQEKSEIEQQLQFNKKYTSLLSERDEATETLKRASAAEQRARTELQLAMAEAWRTLLREPVRDAIASAQTEANEAYEGLLDTLRTEAIERGTCGICEQQVTTQTAEILRAKINADTRKQPTNVGAAMARLQQLSNFNDTSNEGEVRQLWRQINDAIVDQVTCKDRITDLNAALSDADPDVIRRSQAKYAEIIEKISAVKKAIEETGKHIDEKDHAIQVLKKKLDATGTLDLSATRRRAKVLRDAADIFAAAVDRYKAALRTKVEETGTRLFKLMTTEQQDYVGLRINESYGLNIIHRDGRAEEARSAGAEHVVALALMGALQHNAPLRGPIVMDSPFGRLDERHTSNVVKALPEMAEQVVLLVYEAEVGRSEIRELLGPRLVREYELERISSRRTNVREIK